MRRWLICSLLAFLPLVGEEAHQVVILGGGIGGMTSAIYAGRAGMTPLVIQGPVPGGAITQSHTVQNWPGELEIPGMELTQRVQRQAESCGAEFLQEEVIAVDFSQRPFTITTQDPLDSSRVRKIKAQSCIIALGSSSKFLQVPGESEYWLNGEYNCAVCDGALFKDKVVAVVGGGDGAIVEAHYLAKLAKKVYIIVRKDGFKTVEEGRKKEVLAKANVEVRYQTTVEELKGNRDKLTSIVLKNRQGRETLPIDGLFLAIGSKPNTDLFQGQLKLDSLGYIVLEGDVHTSVPGVFAIGDIADPIYRQAISAAADGMKASYHVDKFLSILPQQEETLLMNLASRNATDTGRVIELSTVDQFDGLVRDSHTPIFVDYYATWCGPCTTIAPLFSSSSQTLGGKVTFIKVNVDQFPQLGSRYNIGSLPTLLVIDRNGNVISKKTGVKPISRLLQDSSRALVNSPPHDVDTFLQNYAK